MNWLSRTCMMVNALKNARLMWGFRPCDAGYKILCNTDYENRSWCGRSWSKFFNCCQDLRHLLFTPQTALSNMNLVALLNQSSPSKQKALPLELFLCTHLAGDVTSCEAMQQWKYCTHSMVQSCMREEEENALVYLFLLWSILLGGLKQVMFQYEITVLP
jgi:hypothetical protein